MRASLLLSIVANGDKIPPTIILKGKNGEQIDKECQLSPEVIDKIPVVFTQYNALE